LLFHLQDFAFGVSLPQLVLCGFGILRLDHDVADALGLDLKHELPVGGKGDSRRKASRRYN
jgi:hypothetical protein